MRRAKKTLAFKTEKGVEGRVPKWLRTPNHTSHDWGPPLIDSSFPGASKKTLTRLESRARECANDEMIMLIVVCSFLAITTLAVPCKESDARLHRLVHLTKPHSNPGYRSASSIGSNNEESSKIRGWLAGGIEASDLVASPI